MPAEDDKSPLHILDPSSPQLANDTESLSEVLFRSTSTQRDSSSPRSSTFDASSNLTKSTLSAISVLSATSDEIILRFHHHDHPSDLTNKEEGGTGLSANVEGHDGGPNTQLTCHLHSSVYPPEDTSAQVNSLLRAFANTGLAVDPSQWLGAMGEKIEKTFWSIVLPPMERLFGSGQASLPPNSALPMEGRQTAGIEYKVKEHLYTQETIYTLRFPQEALQALADSVGEDREIGVDLGATKQPVWIRKRAAIPDWSDPRGEKWDRRLSMGGDYGRFKMGMGGSRW